MDVRRVDSEAEMADALTVRREVFIEEQGVPEDLEIDGKDEEAIHFVAYSGGDAVGAARLREHDEAAAKVERVAVVEDERETGLGRAIMDTVEDAARAEGYESVLLHAQAPVIGFYETLGYEITSDEFEEAGIPHREMRKSL
ncbi:GNAT family N-acetyltransferase [Natronomonas halophila]|uniref:GNAT family N-acetyltransferase n=1 Tax=Natronomonas halophila TaxID=2747817 RepID=UPI0015B612A2|nr:GNAT family N-acetyltransferase [Natronomonas halophila]QLD87167.1 GNAT family N-acetyltransferase [Natronomonas halophila]